MGRRQEAGERAPTRQKISVFDKREQRPSLLVLCLARRKKTKSTDVWIYTNRTNNGETSA